MTKAPNRDDPRSYGVDGCRAGWFWVGLSNAGHHFGIVPNPAALLDLVDGSGPLLIDIPIGLSEDGGQRRQCDTLARKLIGRRSSSVFTPPCRAALDAGEYSEACDINQAETGRRLSRQCWGIVPKIREADALMRSSARARSIVRESHPELCFTGLNGGKPMKHPKRQKNGYLERLRILRRHHPGAESVVDEALASCRRAQAARDDIVDALVLAIVAGMRATRLGSVPEEPERDARGLLMQMVWPPPHAVD